MKLEDRILEGPRSNLKAKIIKRIGKAHIMTQIKYKHGPVELREWKKRPYKDGKGFYVERRDWT